MANEQWGHLAVDWPKKQVERIDGTLEEMAQSVVEVEARATDLENRLREAEQRVRMARRKLEDMDRDRQDLGLRVRKLEDRLEIGDPDDETEPFEVWTERQLDKLAVVVRELQNSPTCVTRELLGRIDKLEYGQNQTDEAFDRLQRKHRTLVESQNDWTQQFGERLVRLESELWPLGRPIIRQVDAGEWSGPPQNTVGMMAIPEDMTTVELNPGPILEEAVKRVEGYMRGSFSEGTIGGVVQALRGREFREFPMPSNEDQVTDHSFRFAAPDRRHCSYVYNREENPCGKTRQEHAIKGSDPVKPRPIRDNPQA